LIGTSVPRIDGLRKVSGAAKYSFDVNLPGLLYGRILRSPHPRCKIASIDLSPAEQMAGVKAVHPIKGKDADLHYAGDEIAAVAAVSEDVAEEALRAIKIEYQVLPAITSEEDALKAGAPAARKGNVDERGDPIDEALKSAAASHEGIYGCDVITHVCLETHGLVAKWDGDILTVWASTQAVHGTKDALVNHFKTPNVTCICDYMGGGFGAKFGPDVQGIAAAELAKKAGAPVKLMLDRAEEHVAGGNRPSGYARVRAGADKEGKLVAFDAESWGTGGHSRSAGFPLPYIYEIPNRRRVHTDLFINAGEARAMRAPGHPQGCLITESLMDDLCHKLDPGFDPVTFRLRNLPAGPLREIWTKELHLGAARIGWPESWHPRGDKTPGPWKRGLGCAIDTWGGRAGSAQATCTIHGNGRVEVECGSQDLGTGTTTLVPLVAAEILGLQVADVTGRIGSSQYPPAGGSGGSTSCGGVSLAVAVAAEKALKELLEKAAPALGVPAADLVAEHGRVYIKSDIEKGFTWKQACALLGQGVIRASASEREGQGMSSSGVGGAQFADVSVDVETGRVRLNKIVAIADCGLVMNRLLCESQVYGGVIMGINYGLYEQRRLDRPTGLQVNPDMENYLLAGPSDIPEIDLVLLDYPERGVIGIGEPPTIPTAAAIANAVANAIGVRVPTIPITPRRVLEALEGRA
jgi:xanthine dehydrogenase YagR molybdenum-binding subunit